MMHVLVSIGGYEAEFSIASFAKHAQEVMGINLKSAHFLKLIDNNLPLPEDIPTFGFETA